MVESFNLSDYTSDILKLAAKNPEMSIEAALQCFIENLACMREHYQGCPQLNYHTLGQQWNKLPSKTRVAQKFETLARLHKYAKTGGK